jgi:heme-degrading monooxygenase HmoA
MFEKTITQIKPDLETIWFYDTPDADFAIYDEVIVVAPGYLFHNVTVVDDLTTVSTAFFETKEHYEDFIASTASERLTAYRAARIAYNTEHNIAHTETEKLI